MGGIDLPGVDLPGLSWRGVWPGLEGGAGVGVGLFAMLISMGQSLATVLEKRSQLESM